MEVKLDAEVVERAVADAIVNSAIGAQIKQAVNDTLKAWDSPIRGAINRVIAEIALKIVREEYEPQIREAVKAKMQEETVDAFVGIFWEAVIKRHA